MLDLGVVRDAIGGWLDERKSAVKRIYPRAIGGAFQWPAVLIGQPALEEPDVQPCGIDRWTVPVHVAVGRPGADEEATQRLLEDCWMETLKLVRQLVDEDVLDVTMARVVRSDFGSLIVAGQAYPAYEISLEIYG